MLFSIYHVNERNHICTFLLGFASQWQMSIYGKQITEEQVLWLSFLFAFQLICFHWFKSLRWVILKHETHIFFGGLYISLKSFHFSLLLFSKITRYNMEVGKIIVQKYPTYFTSNFFLNSQLLLPWISQQMQYILLLIQKPCNYSRYHNEDTVFMWGICM